MGEADPGGDDPSMVLLTDTRETLAQSPPDRYVALIERGFSPQTSAIIADAPVSLAAITLLLLPDRE
jgi:hypothetical protein